MMIFQTIFYFKKTYKLDIETQVDTQKIGNMSLQILRKDENEMAKKEVKTDLWVARQLDDSKIKYDAQGSDVKEINDALQSASKRGTDIVLEIIMQSMIQCQGKIKKYAFAV